MWLLFGSVYWIYVNQSMQNNNKYQLKQSDNNKYQLKQSDNNKYQLKQSNNKYQSIQSNINKYQAAQRNIIQYAQYRSTQFSTSQLVRQYKPAGLQTQI